MDTSAPPIKGTRSVPPVTPDVIVPKAAPACFFGVSVAIKELAFETKPANTPCSIRKTISSYTFCTAPNAAMTIAIPRKSRRIINFRPFWSANLPQYGEVMADTTYITEKPIPAKNTLTDKTRKLRFHIGAFVLALQWSPLPKTKRDWVLPQPPCQYS